MKLQDKIDEIFTICSSSSSIGTADFKSICRHFWYHLDNSVTIVDLAGVFTVCIPSNGAEVLTIDIFPDFIKALARVKYPVDSDYCEKFVMDVLENMKDSNKNNSVSESLTFSLVMDRHVMRTLLKFDIPIRRAFSHFCGQSVRVGGRLNWEEIRSLSIGMEVDGFVAFAGEYSLIPTQMSTDQCEKLFRDVINRYPLKNNKDSMGSALLFPQFQFLLVKAAIDRQNNNNNNNKEGKRSVADLLTDLLRDIGIGRTVPESSLSSHAKDSFSPVKGGGVVGNRELEPDIYQHNGGLEHSHMLQYSPKKKSEVVKPSSDRPQDMHSAAGNHGRQAMMLRMEHLFDEVETRLLTRIPADDPLLQTAQTGIGEVAEVKAKLPSKPVVIGDAIPIPSVCPQEVQQLLEAALAHHNLGSYEESLKFLEASSIQLTDIQYRSKEIADQQRKSSSRTTTTTTTDFFDLEMYIVLCKGNVYQSCGDDEQSLLHYLEAFSKAGYRSDKEWELISLSCVGLLAYFNLRFDVSLLCFRSVALFREETYGNDNADTATAWNNEACCLYCLQKKGEARVRFERSWTTLSNTVGHRSPRAVTVWKNLEKARRSNAALSNRNDIAESISMRVDAEKLILGGSFTIQGLPPIEGGGRGKKKGKGGKGKKKRNEKKR